MDIQALVTAQRAYFKTGATLPLSARRGALQRLRAAMKAHETDITAALKADLNKSPAESYMCEVGLTLSELTFVERRLARWMKDRPHLTPLAQFPARSFTVSEPMSRPSQPSGISPALTNWLLASGAKASAMSVSTASTRFTPLSLAF